MDTVKNNVGFQVVPLKEAPRRSLAFQDSFRGFLDGSEFMRVTYPPTPDSLDFLSPAADGEDEAQKIEAAICKARKMARECSLQTIGTYQPYDVVDPTTWDRTKKGKQKKRRESVGCQSSSSSRSTTQEGQEFSAKGSAMATTSSHNKDRRASEPTSSAFGCDQMHSADSVQQDDRKIKDSRRSGRHAGHRSHSPSRKSSGKKEKRSRRVPIVKTSELRETHVHDASRDRTTEVVDFFSHQIAPSSTASSSWWKEDPLSIRIEEVDLRQGEERFPETRRGSSGEMYRSDQSLSICSQSAKERENLVSPPSSVEKSVILQLELKERMLQERLLETTRKLSELNKETTLPSNDSTAPAAKPGLRCHMPNSEQEGVNLKARKRL
jgi:hypothetical protein